MTITTVRFAKSVGLMSACFLLSSMTTYSATTPSAFSTYLGVSSGYAKTNIKSYDLMTGKLPGIPSSKSQPLQLDSNKNGVFVGLIAGLKYPLCQRQYFVSPSCFYEYTINGSKKKEGSFEDAYLLNYKTTKDISLSHSFGLMSNLGINITPKFSLYVGLGVLISQMGVKINTAADHGQILTGSLNKNFFIPGARFVVGCEFALSKKLSMTIQASHDLYQKKRVVVDAVTADEALKTNLVSINKPRVTKIQAQLIRYF